MIDLIEKVENWAKSKGIDQAKSHYPQTCTILQEIAEFETEVPSEKPIEYGDILVTLIIFAQQQHLDFYTSFSLAQDRYKTLSAGALPGLTRDPVKGAMINLGHLSDAMTKQDKQKIIKYFHALCFDVVSVLHWQSKWMGGTTPRDCLRLAHTKISKRKGKKINGRFVKESDL